MNDTPDSRPAPSPRRRVAAPVLLTGLLALVAGAAPADAQQEGPLPDDEGVQRLTADEAVRVALANSPALRSSRADVSTARAGKTGAVGAFLPNLSMGYGFSDASTGRLDPTGQSITRTSYTTQLQASLNLFDGLRRFDELESAEHTVEARRADLRRQRYQTSLDVKRAYYDAVAARERVEVERARVERQREQLDFVRQRIRQGQATRSDSLRSRVDLNDAQLALLNARNEARSAQFALAEAMGVDRRVGPVETATLAPDTLEVDREELMRAARGSSPRVVAARRSAEAAEASVASARSSYLPSLQLSGGYAWQNAEFPPKNRSWQLQISGSLPLFDGLGRETEVSRANAQAEAARARVRTAELAVRSEVDDAYSQLRTALAGLELARESVELSREDLRVTRQRYRLGAATILDLQSAQIALQQAQVDVIRRQFDYQVGLARLESVLGTDVESLTGSAGDSAAALDPSPDAGPRPAASDTESSHR